MKVSIEAVGKNLIEHATFPILGFYVNDSSYFPKMDPSVTQNISAEYHNGEGLLTTHTTATSNNEQGVLTMMSVGAQCFIASSKSESGWPDIWIEMQPYVTIDGSEQGITLYSSIGRPHSRGLLTIDTDKYKAGIRDDVQLANIDYKMLTHPDDVDIMLEGNIKSIWYTQRPVIPFTFRL